jgi:flavin reductase (DIM6/NTAB) family NADH-FMN oxidoreductase RutF
MARKPVPYTHQFAQTMCQLGGDGLLLVATKPGGESDVTTICWGKIGPVWGRPVFAVLARPSRYTYQFIEEVDVFTVNVPTPAMSEFALFCGTKSGRAHDKLARFQMSVSPRANGQIRDH